MSEKRIPESVAQQVFRALDGLRSIKTRVASYVDVDTRFGGDGRYESECYRTLEGEMNAHLAFIAKFSECARGLGIDAEAQLAAWGGVPAVELTGRARVYMSEFSEVLS